MHACMHDCIYANACMHIQMHACKRMQTAAHACMQMHAETPARMQKRLYACNRMHAYADACMHACMHIQTHACKCMHARICKCMHASVGCTCMQEKRRHNDMTHKWTCLLRSPDGEDISHFIKKVVFELDPSFVNPRRSPITQGFRV